MHNQKRRKKRQTHGVKTVEIARGRNGYGFTISGQQPCILSCIVAGSPAEKAGLKAGDLLLAVNGDNISRAPHDDAVRLIGSSSGVLVLQIAENQNSSDSSDDDYHYSQKPRSKFPSRLRNRNQNIYRSEKVIADLKAGVIFHERTNLTKPVRKHGSPAAVTVDSRTYTDGTHNSGKTKSYGKFASPTMDGNSNEPPLSNRHEVIHVFGPPEKVEKPEERRRSPLNNNLRQAVNFARSLPNLVPSVIQAPDCEVPSGESRILRVVVGYIGSIEVPAECSRPNSQILSIKNAVRRLHVEQRIHTLVLLEVDSDEVRLRNVHGKTVAVYPADKLAFSGVCPDDKTFFGLITFQAMESNESTNPHSRNPNNISSSCHVFMVKSDLRHHSSHSEHAWSFGFKCNQHDDVCLEFPWSADPILRAIASIQKVCVDPDSFVDLNAANQSFSSNSDSGLGFGREEINNDQVYVVDCNEENTHQVQRVDYRLTREANRISSALRPYHRPQLSLGAESVSSAFVSSQPYKTSTPPVNALQGSPLSDSFRVPSSILSNTFSPKDNLDQQNSADNLRKNMHKLLTARNRYSHDLQSGSSDAESVRSENTHVRSQSISNTPNRPVSVPNDQTFGVSHRHLHTLKISSPERINKLSPRAITPRKEINDKYYDEELPENLQRTLHDAMDHVVQSENKKPLVQSLKDSGDETLKQGKIGSTAVSSSNVCDNQPHGKSGRKSEGTGRATGWAISLDKLLTDHAGRAALKEFLRKEFSEENIVFWTVCEDYRKINDFEQRKVFGKEIVKKHLCLRSSEPVNIDSHARKQAEDNLDRADVNLFNEAQAQIFQLMKHDSYNRFLKSDVYKQCVIADIENLPYPFVTAEDIKKVEVSTVERKKKKVPTATLR